MKQVKKAREIRMDREESSEILAENDEDKGMKQVQREEGREKERENIREGLTTPVVFNPSIFYI